MIERVSTHSGTALLLVAMAVAIVLAGCSSEPQPVPTATPDIAAMVSTAVEEALCARANAPAEVRPGYCGRLCGGDDYWKTADIADVKAAIHCGVDVNAADEQGWTPLHNAVLYGHTDIVSLLLENGANVDAPSPAGNWPALVLAIHDSHSDIVVVLLNNGADVTEKDSVGFTPLHHAVSKLESSVIALMLDKGADVNARNEYGVVPLHFVAWEDKPSVVRLLLSRGAKIDARTAQGMTPCHNALEANRSVEIINLLC